jgi:tetratricopeptide (TPR) repeat protein
MGERLAVTTSWSRLVPALIAAAGLAAILTGCQTAGPPVQVDPSAWSFAADADSLGVDAFLERPERERRSRRAEARRWLQRAHDASDLVTELRALRTAAGLDPTSGTAWLQLMRRTRWFGDYQQTEDALGGFYAALDHIPQDRHALAARVAVCMAWLRYDRGEWRDGLAWTDSAAVHGAPEEELQLLRALHWAGEGRNRRAEDIAYRFAQMDHRSHWIYGVSFWRRESAEPAHAIFTGRSGVSLKPDVIAGSMYPQEPRAAECFRDFGLVEELMGNWWLAEQQYEAAIKHVRDADPPHVQRVDHPPLGRSASAVRMPIWLAFDRYYVTGSISAYADLAFDRYRAATDPARREFWASAAVDAAGTCVRLKIDEAWARRSRGLVLADFRDQREQARHDLLQAQRAFDRRAIEDLETIATLGNLYLRAERPQQARPLLEKAVALGPDRARAWSDLGLALVQLGEEDRALPALEQALALDPELAVAWYNRGLLRYHLDDLAGAVADLERAHELAPGDQNIGALLEQLRRRIQETPGS